MASLFHTDPTTDPADALVDLAADLASPVPPGHWDSLRSRLGDGSTGAPLAAY